MKLVRQAKFDYHQAQYVKSAVELNQLPADKGWEVAFIGRSNAGKSSAINAITGIKGLARTSSTPGQTQMINIFSFEKDRRLMDLPGYGYAKVPRTIKERWQHTTNEYLETRQCLRGLILVMDIRHPLKEIDEQLIAWTIQCEVPVHILLTKADKLTAAEGRKVLKEVSEALAPYSTYISVQIFSAMQHQGIEEAQLRLDEWFSKE